MKLELAEREKTPAIFSIPGRGSQAIRELRDFLRKHKGDPRNIQEVVCDMSPAFLKGLGEAFPNAAFTVDRFHIMQHFPVAVNSVRRIEIMTINMPKGARWAVLRGDSRRTASQNEALQQLFDMGTNTSTAFLIKEKLRWIRQAD